MAKVRADPIAQAQATDRRAWIVFGGREGNARLVGTNVRVSCNGGQGERRADELIVDFVRKAATILKVTRRLRKGGQEFSEPSLNILLDVHDRTMAFAELVSALVKSPRPAFDLEAVQAQSKALHELVRTSRQGQLNRVGANDPNSPVRVLVELDVLNAYERVRAYYLNVAETLAGGK